MAIAESELTLVLGGTGKTGRRVAHRLAKAGRRVRIGSRQAEIPFDWERPESWAPALAGAKAVHVSYQPDLAVPGALKTIEAFFAQALRSGVEKLVLVSGRGEPEAEQAELALQATGADWTILRSSWFCQNFSESFFLEPIRAGEVALPVGATGEPFVDVEDLADTAFAALTDRRHSRRLYELTGPRAVSFADAIGEIARATRRTLAFVPVSAEEYRADLVRQGVPGDYIDLVVYLFATVLDGRNTPVADGIERALGRAPAGFSDYVRRTAATGVWSAGQA